MPTVLVTGAAGLLGANFSRYLIDNGYDETTVKRILNQKVSDTVLQHYDSADFIDKKREALQLYADFCYPKGYKR